MAGYSGTPLIRKLGIKPENKVLLINQPDHYFDMLGENQGDIDTVTIDYSESINFIHYFCRDLDELHNLFPILKEKLAKNGMIWISWIKKASKNYDWTFTETEVRSYGLQIGLVDVKVCAVDEDWSGLKFMYRKEDR
ncbi:MAG: DUF3052 family protein [Balneolaceae bacterium]|nr:DUF3052 family protein [Balneolaceae bacterium]MBO6545388.1 DUF3052 family protein [Balneolaceae bacterium]MBO6646784.1 DUF3052 family protein [Balneolaceae bacterium]